MKYRAVLVENEEHSRSRLRRLLAEFPEHAEIVGESADGPAAVAMICALKPDLVFLDIDLPGINGFEVLAQLDVQPAVIFTTAFNQSALEALRTHAVDYLLKPIDESSIEQAFRRLDNIRFEPGQVTDVVQPLLAAVRTPYLVKLACKAGDRTVSLKMGEVMYLLQSDAVHTTVYTANSEFLVDASLADLEFQLDPRDFVRIHRTTLVNVSWVAEMRRSFDGKLKVLLKDAKGSELMASRIYADSLRKL